MLVEKNQGASSITISNLPNGTYTWNPAGSGTSSITPCSSSEFAPFFTVTPASATGTSVTFQFSATSASAPEQGFCTGTVVNQNGTPILVGPPMGPGSPLNIDLFVDEFPG
jgi:hypothetical protein